MVRDKRNSNELASQKKVSGRSRSSGQRKEAAAMYKKREVEYSKVARLVLVSPVGSIGL